MRYFKGLFIASKPRVEFCSSRVPWVPHSLEGTLVLLEVLVPSLPTPAHTSQKLGVKGTRSERLD